MSGSGVHCPRCAAAVRVGAPWCTQCYGRLEPTPSAVPVADSREPRPALLPPSGALVAVQLLPEELRSPGAPSGDASWPCTACGTANLIEDGACASCGEPFLAGLRVGRAPTLELPGIGDVAALSRAQRLGLGVAVVGVVLVLVLLLGLLTS